MCFSACYKRCFPHVQSALLLLQLGTTASCPFICISSSVISVIRCRYTSRRLLLDSSSCFVSSRPEKPISPSFPFYIGYSTPLTLPLVLSWTCSKLIMLLQAVRCKTGHRCQGSESIPPLGSWAPGAQDQHPPADCGQRLPGSAVGTPRPGMTSCSVPKEAPDAWGWGGGTALATRSCPATLGDSPTAPGAWGALNPLNVPHNSRCGLTRAEEKRIIPSLSPLLKCPLSTMVTAVQWLILWANSSPAFF